MPDSWLLAARRRYGVYGLVVESELRLASVEEAGVGGAAAIHLAPGPPEFFCAKAAGLVFDPDDWVRHAVLGDGSVYLKVDGIFEAVVSADGREIACAQTGAVDRRSFEAHLLNFVLSAALTLQGEELLHSTVVEIDGRAVGLLGPSGAGKSTLAAALIANGAGLITDDMLRLTWQAGAPLAQPGPHRLKLFDAPARRFLPRAATGGHFNALNGKIMVQPRPLDPRVARHGVPLAALFWIGDDSPPDGGPFVRRLAGTELAKVLLCSAMNSRYQAIDRLARQIVFAERLARAIPVLELRYARTFALMDRVVAEVRGAVSSPAASLPAVSGRAVAS